MFQFLGILNRLLGSKAGGIKNIKGNLQNGKVFS